MTAKQVTDHEGAEIISRFVSIVDIQNPVFLFQPGYQQQRKYRLFLLWLSVSATASTVLNQVKSFDAVKNFKCCNEVLKFASPFY